MLHILNYIVTLLLQIWLFLKHLCGLNCTTLYRVPLSLTQLVISDVCTPPLFHYSLYHNWPSTTQVVYAVQIRKLLCIQLQLLMWMYAATARSALAASSPLQQSSLSLSYCSIVGIWIWCCCCCWAAQYSPNHITSASYKAELCSMFDYVGLLSHNSSYTSRQVSCEPMRGANYSTRALNCSSIHSSYCGYQRFLHTSGVALMSCAATTTITVRQDCALFIHETAASLTSACCCLVIWSTNNRILK